jgi:hypothetical protein
MACNIENITKKLDILIDQTVKGNAASVEQDANGNFHIHWSPELKVKTRDQAFRMAQQKIRTVNEVLIENKFNPVKFGPFLVMDSTLTDRISLIKVTPTKLTQFLEWRNQAEEQERDLQEYLAEKEQEDNKLFFAEQAEDEAVLEEQNDNKEDITPDNLPPIKPICE